MDRELIEKLEAMAERLRSLEIQLAEADALRDEVALAMARTDIGFGGTVPEMHVEDGGMEGWPYDRIFPFGLAIKGAVVTVYPGTVEVGGTPRTSISTDITIDSDGQYIGLELDRTGSGITITGPHDEWPVSADSKYRTALWTFNLENGAAVLVGTPILALRFNAII